MITTFSLRRAKERYERIVRGYGDPGLSDRDTLELISEVLEFRAAANTFEFKGVTYRRGDWIKLPFGTVRKIEKVEGQ